MRYNPPFGLTDPEPSFGAEPYINGDPSIGRAGSIPPAAMMEYPQREIVAVIQYAKDNGLIDFNDDPCATPTNADLTQLLKAIFGMIHKPTGDVIKLQVDTTIEINSSTGNDSTADGTLLLPFQTLQAANDYAQRRLDLNLKHTITFHAVGTFNTVGTSVYVAGLFAGQNGAQSIIWDLTSASINATHGSCFYINQGAQATIKNGSLTATWDGVSTSQGVGILIGGFGFVLAYGQTYGSCEAAHIFSYGGLDIVGPYTINGNSPSHVVVQPSGSVAYSNGPWTVTVAGTPTFSDAFAKVYGGWFAPSGYPYSGLASGKRYDISGFGEIFTAGGGSTYLPGNVAGTIATNTGNGEYT